MARLVVGRRRGAGEVHGVSMPIEVILIVGNLRY
jgi:hypothetical protein